MTKTPVPVRVGVGALTGYVASLLVWPMWILGPPRSVAPELYGTPPNADLPEDGSAGRGCGPGLFGTMPGCQPGLECYPGFLGGTCISPETRKRIDDASRNANLGRIAFTALGAYVGYRMGRK